MTVDPRHMTLTEWAEATVLPLSRFTIAPRLLRAEDWKIWARIITQNPAIARYQPPDPGPFSDWREWAFRFNQAVPL